MCPTFLWAGATKLVVVEVTAVAISADSSLMAVTVPFPPGALGVADVEGLGLTIGANVAVSSVVMPMAQSIQ